jgi:tRNA pseudouridine55 synthase
MDQLAALSGFILIDKVPGITSFQSLNRIKKALGTKKVGHTGTLDKFASGLLIALAGKATKQASQFEGFDKIYEATFLFGQETDTLDPEGSVIAEAQPPGIEALKAVLPQFHGTIMQSPPAYSAVHINGKRAYKLALDYKTARSGNAPVMEARPVTIYDLELLSWEEGRPALGRFRIHCSKGTYIRSLARDIALKAGSRAYVVELRRTAIGPYRVEDALRLDKASDDDIRGALR